VVAALEQPIAIAQIEFAFRGMVLAIPVEKGSTVPQ